MKEKKKENLEEMIEVLMPGPDAIPWVRAKMTRREFYEIRRTYRIVASVGLALTFTIGAIAIKQEYGTWSNAYHAVVNGIKEGIKDYQSIPPRVFSP